MSTRPLFLKPQKKWPRLVGLLVAFGLCGVGSYWLGDKNATEGLTDALQATCGRSPTIIEFGDGSRAACMPLRQQPNVEEKFQRGLDKDPVV